MVQAGVPRYNLHTTVVFAYLPKQRAHDSWLCDGFEIYHNDCCLRFFSMTLSDHFLSTCSEAP